MLYPDEFLCYLPVSTHWCLLRYIKYVFFSSVSLREANFSTSHILGFHVRSGRALPTEMLHGAVIFTYIWVIIGVYVGIHIPIPWSIWARENGRNFPRVFIPPTKVPSGKRLCNFGQYPLFFGGGVETALFLWPWLE